MILNYNGGELLKDCVESFAKVTFPNLEVLVIDNGSSDGSLEPLYQITPKPRILKSRVNLGYTGGNNLGIETALQNGADYVLVVNADVLVLNPDFIRELVEFSDARDDAGIVGPKVFFRSEDRVQNTIIQVPKLTSTSLWWFVQRFGKKRLQSGDHVLEVPVLNGVCILLRKEMLEDVGFFDLDTFMYREDTDLALRANTKGWKSYYLPTPSILHLQKNEGYDYLSLVNFLLKRNAVHVLLKNRRRFDAFGFAASAIILTLARAMIATIRGDRVAENWRFLRVLSGAIVCALRGNVESPDFGPPVASWSELKSRC